VVAAHRRGRPDHLLRIKETAAMPSTAPSPFLDRLLPVLALAGLLGLTSGLAAATVTLAQEGAPAAETLEQGRTIYGEQCESCHGPEGKGNGPASRFLDPPARDFTSGEWRHATDGTLENVARVVREGVDDTGMTPFADLLDEQQTNAVAAYVVHVLAKKEDGGR
jgi:mono/diheme cytochrome c family protein